MNENKYMMLTDLLFWCIDEVSKGNIEKRNRIYKVYERLSGV